MVKEGRAAGPEQRERAPCEKSSGEYVRQWQSPFLFKERVQYNWKFPSQMVSALMEGHAVSLGTQKAAHQERWGAGNTQ